MNYCTRSDVRDYGLTATEASDVRVDQAIELASRVIDAVLPASWDAGVATITVHDVRGDIVPLDGPFSDITSVEVNGASIDASRYDVEPWGLRLRAASIKDIDGFPVYGYAYQAARGRRGASVSVTATFGHDGVPELVKHACVVLAADFAQRTPSEPLPPDVGSLSREGHSVTFRDRKRELGSTGNTEADALLEPFLSKVHVG